MVENSSVDVTAAAELPLGGRCSLTDAAPSGARRRMRDGKREVFDDTDQRPGSGIDRDGSTPAGEGPA